jgi:RimJ/RimL family protein N-acetyltransferase
VTFEIRELKREDADVFRSLRRERLEQSPRSFAESLAEHDSIPASQIASRLTASSPENFVMGAFAPTGQLIAMVGFSRSPRVKTHHKAVIWGVYVQPTWRNQGVARALLTAVVEKAKTNAGLEQINLTVAADQIAAKRLYLSLGFTPFGHEKHALKLETGYVDEDHMVLSIK